MIRVRHRFINCACGCLGLSLAVMDDDAKRLEREAVESGWTFVDGVGWIAPHHQAPYRAGPPQPARARA